MIVDEPHRMIRFFKRSTIEFGLKIVVTLCIVVWLWSQLKHKNLLNDMRLCPLSVWAACILSLWLSTLCSGIRTFWIIQERDATQVKLKDVVVLSFLGNFLSQGLPSSLGGDVYRLWALSRWGLGKSESFFILILDRCMGIASMLILGIGALIIRMLYEHPALTNTSRFLLFVYFSIIFTMAALTIISFIKTNISNLFKGALKTLWLKIYRALDLDFDRKKYLSTLIKPKIYLINFVITVTLFLPFIWLSSGLGSPLKPHVLFGVLPFVFLMTSLPLSFGGWGVREAALFSLVGSANNSIVAVSMLYGIVTLLAAVPACLLFYRHTPSASR